MTTTAARAANRPARQRDPSEQVRREARRERLFYWIMLGATVSFPVLVAVLFEPGSQLFLLKATAVVLLASLPGWLYLEFVRSKGHSLYDEYVINLFRLRIDRYANLPAPPEHTDWYKRWKKPHDELKTTSRDNLYRRKFEAVFGEQAVSTRALIRGDGGEAGRRRRHKHSETFRPVLLASLLLTIGWTVVITPELYRSIRLLDPLLFSGRPQLPAEALRFGFVGAYWFILQDLIRRYFRDDLKTTAYVSVSARIIVVVVLVATMSLIPLPLEEQAVLAFLVGIFPQLGMQVLKTGVGKLGKRMVENLERRYPLSDLDGLTIWDEARLAEEGVEDLQGLTTANLVDLLLHTRIPIVRLVDWLDQAFLYLRLPEGDEGKQMRAKLRALGIRGATDLERIWSAGADGEALRAAVARALDGDPVTVEALVTSFRGDVNLAHVRAFRRFSWLDDDVVEAARKPGLEEVHQEAA
jgi:hypothetical protein